MSVVVHVHVKTEEWKLYLSPVLSNSQGGGLKHVPPTTFLLRRLVIGFTEQNSAIGPIPKRSPEFDRVMYITVMRFNNVSGGGKIKLTASLTP